MKFIKKILSFFIPKKQVDHDCECVDIKQAYICPSCGKVQ